VVNIRCVIDTSIIIEVFDKGKSNLLDYLLSRCDEIFIPWVVLYEYLYGHKYLGKPITKRKEVLEKLGTILWINQEIIERALDIDVGLHKEGTPIPFSDILISSTALQLNSELITLNERHYRRIKNLRIHVPKLE